MRRLFFIVALTVLIGMAIFLLFGREAGVSERLNLVLITLDTIRADHLGCYGYWRDTSPSIDRFSEGSILFERCIVPLATTLPSHVSILTSTYPLEHGVLANVSQKGNKFIPTPELQSLAMVCGELGYRTAAFISAAPVKIGTGIEEGFEVYNQPMNSGIRAAGPTTDSVLAWLNVQRQAPFFLWVHYYDPHHPYSSPAPFDSLFKTDEGLEAFIEKRQIPESASNPMSSVRVKTQESINAYDGAIRYLDSELARLFHLLDSPPYRGRTAILLLGDHGEGLVQHNEVWHGGAWHEQLWAPMMIHGPGIVPRRVSRLLSAVDAIPTFLGLFEVGGFEGFLAEASGRNVLSPGFMPAPVFSQESGEKKKTTKYRYALTGDRWKYIWNNRSEAEMAGKPGWLEYPENLLFDLEEDPFELNDISTQHPALVTALKEQIISRIQAQRVRGEVLRKDQAPADPVDSALVEDLKALGYVDD